MTGKEESIYPLTAREFDVARLVADGLTNAQICLQLGIRPSTVATHIDHINRKLHTRNRVEITVWFLRGRLITRAKGDVIEA